MVKKQILNGLLLLIGLSTLINIIIMYWIPSIFLVSMFGVMRLTMIAYIERKYWLLVIVIFLSVLTILIPILVKRKSVVLPLLYNGYLIYDLSILLPLLFHSICTQDGYGWDYLIHVLLDVIVIVLICFCIWEVIRKQRFARK